MARGGDAGQLPNGKTKPAAEPGAGKKAAAASKEKTPAKVPVEAGVPANDVRADADHPLSDFDPETKPPAKPPVELPDLGKPAKSRRLTTTRMSSRNKLRWSSGFSRSSPSVRGSSFPSSGGRPDGL